MQKVTYVNGITVIGADNLNEIQDAIIDLENDTGAVPTNVRQAMLTLFESAAYAETGLTDEIAVVQSWASEVTSLSLSASTLSLNGDTPQTIVATTVPSGSAVVWSTSDSTIATVVGGVVTGISNGSCTITASSGDKSATCAVTVTGFAVLESISAVYTQSGTVYETDSLDSLKADLVVTATYSDSTTAVVTDYILSGTLTEGTSTITVVYGGKTTTFSVTVTAWDDYYYSMSNGQLEKIVAATSGYVSSNKNYGRIGLYFENTSRRSFPIKKVGVKPMDSMDDSTQDFIEATEYYPIPIPADAISATITITPATQYHGECMYTYAGGKYIRQLDPGWKQGSFTHSFTAGQYEYITVTSKYNSAGTSYPTEPTEVTITFLTE